MNERLREMQSEGIDVALCRPLHREESEAWRQRLASWLGMPPTANWREVHGEVMRLSHPLADLGGNQQVEPHTCDAVDPLPEEQVVVLNMHWNDADFAMPYEVFIATVHHGLWNPGPDEVLALSTTGRWALVLTDSGTVFGSTGIIQRPPH